MQMGQQFEAKLFCRYQQGPGGKSGFCPIASSRHTDYEIDTTTWDIGGNALLREPLL